MKKGNFGKQTVTLLVILSVLQRVLSGEAEVSESHMTKTHQEEVGGEHLLINNTIELLATTGRMGTPGYLVLICGKDRLSNNHCPEIAELFSVITKQYPGIKSNTIYYDLNEGEIEILQYFNVESIPHIMFIKDRRIWYYREKNYTNYNVARFANHFAHNPDYLWRSFPTEPRTRMQGMMEGIWNTFDRVYLISGGNIWVIRAFNAIFIGIGLLFAYALIVIGYEMITGKVYEDLDKDKKAQNAPDNPNSLKVKRE